MTDNKQYTMTTVAGVPCYCVPCDEFDAWQAAKSVPVGDVKDGISSPHNACQHRNECMAKAAELSRLRKDAERPDCTTCANRGRVNGLSQETYCRSCIFHESWRSNHYAAIDGEKK